MLKLRGNLFFIAVCAAATFYSVVRYNILKHVSWSHLPLFVLNKAAAWSSVILFAAGAWHATRRGGRGLAGTPAFRQGTALAALHVVASIALMGPATYPELYEVGGRFTGWAEGALMSGIVAGLVLAGAQRSPMLATPMAVLLATHTALLGVRGWRRVDAWPGQLLSITLLGFLTAVALLAITARWWRHRPD